MSRFHSKFLPRSTAFLLLVLTQLLVAPPPLSAKSQVPANPVPIDFSYAGYEGGMQIPSVKAVLMVKPSGGDDTALIQGALEQVASRPVGADGYRGAVLLGSGRFQVKGQLHLRVSGVVLRGAGQGAGGTVIMATGIERRALIEVGGVKDAPLDSPIAVEDDVQAGGLSLHLASVTGLKVG